MSSSSSSQFTTSRSTAVTRPQTTSLMYTVSIRRLKEMLSHLIPSTTLTSMEEIPSPQLPRLYDLTMSDSSKLLLSFAPSLAVRLFRQEATLLHSEATFVYFIAGSEEKAERLRQEEKGKGKEDEVEELSLTALVPRLLKHSSNTKEMAYPYSVFEPRVGASLSTMAIYLSLPERRSVDKSVGKMARKLAALMSPNGTFGTVSRVILDPFSPVPGIAPQITGSRTWSEAFSSLLEGALRDGEDLAVLLPYETVRAHYQRLAWRLDAVTLPRLVVLDAGRETNILIERAASDDGSSSMTDTPMPPTVKLTGLRSWSQGIFGDPLVGDSFEDPTEPFLEGWREAGEEVIEDVDNADVRLLLYRCYQAVIGIATEYYRPQGDSSRKEMEARRKLTSALQELEKVDVAVSDALKRARSLSGERAPDTSKEPRLEEGSA